MMERQTVAGAFAKIENHEALCAERYRAIFEGLGDLRAKSESHSKLLWGVLLSIAGFLAVTLVAVMLHALKLT
jgi:hypothetical protein